MSDEVSQRIWDVIVIGTGIGGGTIGRRLAEAGLSVLFLEKGPLGLDAEQQYLRTDLEDPTARRIRGYWPKPVLATIDGRQSRFFGPIGSGVGGTSTFYAATLERPERHDIDDVRGRPHPTGGWPVSYAAFKPYFQAAERMYEVHGSHDPLSSEVDVELAPPPPLNADDQAMAEGFRKSGLHPYFVHMGVRFLPGCRLCFGHRCPRKCKLDGRTAGVEPALATGNAVLLDMCDVESINAGRDTVRNIQANHRGKRLQLRARSYVLAAGGLGSPRLLLASQNQAWPNGLGNDNDLVGRNLMFHLMELVAVWPGRGERSAGPSKALALRDFYYVDGLRYGALQALGSDVSYGNIVHYLNGLFDRSVLAKFRALREFTRILAYLAEKLFGSAKMFAAIIEDLPYHQNRVKLDREDPETLCFEYEISQELHERRRRFRKIVRRRMPANKTAFISLAPQLNVAHSCGTLRFGKDPTTSVLNTNCRLHGVRNLYVADSSFMPTSLGINPSLTIAANALRVADSIIAAHKDVPVGTVESESC